MKAPTKIKPTFKGNPRRVDGKHHSKTQVNRGLLRTPRLSSVTWTASRANNPAVLGLTRLRQTLALVKE